MSLYPGQLAHAAGFAENIYLDPATRTRVEETGGANLIFITHDNVFVTPKSSTILPSVTRRSLMTVARDYLGMKVEEREVLFSEVPNFAECGLCGTAAVISPIGWLNYKGTDVQVADGKVGPVAQKLYNTLYGMQTGTVADDMGWTVKL